MNDKRRVEQINCWIDKEWAKNREPPFAMPGLYLSFSRGYREIVF